MKPDMVNTVDSMLNDVKYVLQMAIGEDEKKNDSVVVNDGLFTGGAFIDRATPPILIGVPLQHTCQ